MICGSIKLQTRTNDPRLKAASLEKCLVSVMDPATGGNSTTKWNLGMHRGRLLLGYQTHGVGKAPWFMSRMNLAI